MENENKNSHDVSTALKIRTAYFVCSIIILSAIIIILFTNRFFDNGEYKAVFEYFSFASTITSIILSVIAILLSFMSGD